MSEFAFEPTKQQHDAISLRGENLLVAAGAGSGKTAVLVRRVIEYVDRGGCIERVLALTFTNAAAADMRARIDAALAQAAADRPDDAHLARQAALAATANISTIHSFCLELLRSQHYRVGLPPGFRLAGEAEMLLLKQSVLDELLEQEYARPDSELPALADAFGGNRDDSGLVELVQRLREYSLSRPQPEQWLLWAVGDAADDNSDAACGDAADAPWAVYLQQSLCGSLRQAADGLDEALLWPGLPLAHLQQAADELMQAWQLLRADGGLEAQLTLLAAIELGRMASLSKKARDSAVGGYDEDNFNRFKQRWQQLRDQVKQWQGKCCRRPWSQQLADVAATQPLLSALVRLTLAYGRRVDAEKRRRGWADFADLEHLTLALLQDEQAAAALRQRFDEVLVDEYQDINQVQEAIVSRLAAPGCLFAVGDVKQSIYRFRLAEPGLFMDKYARYGQHQGGRRIDLNRNFRSGAALVQGINFIFSQLMSATVMEIDYDEQARLEVGADFDGFAPEFHLIDMDDAAGDSPPALLAEGRLIARRIRQLRLQQPQLAYRDIAVLLRSSKNREQIIVAALAEANIPAQADSGDSYAESVEVGLALALLHIIDNPAQDVALAAVLRSPLFGFDADELVELRLLDKRASLWQVLQLAVAPGAAAPACAPRVADFLHQLAQWRELAAQRPVSELLLALYHDTALLGLVGAMSDGQRRQANLRLLYAKAHQYEASGYAGLFRFLRLLEDGRSLPLRESAARLPDQGEDAVRVMSIHKSKGLEFPVVFVAGLASRFNTQDERPDVIYQSELGLAARRVERAQRRKYATLSHLAVARRQHEQSLAEELRILYVALTRGKRRLILTAASRRLPQLAQGWADWADQAADASCSLPPACLSAARCPLDWLGPALLRQSSSYALHELCDTPPPFLTRRQLDGGWQCHVWPLFELATPTMTDEPSTDEAATEAATAGAAAQQPMPSDEQLREALNWQYPQARLCQYPAKWSVSALSRLDWDEQAAQELYQLDAAETATADAVDIDNVDDIDDMTENISNQQPQLDRNAAAAANERGSAIHRALELLDFSRSSASEIAIQLDQLQSSGALSPQQAAWVQPELLQRFCDSPLGRRLAAATRLRRESPFTMQVALGGAGEEAALVQGVIDLAFYEDGADGGWVLLDYKSGGRGKTQQQLIAQYGEQLAYYAQAIERLWDAPLKEVWLCMLDLGLNLRM